MLASSAAPFSESIWIAERYPTHGGFDKNGMPIYDWVNTVVCWSPKSLWEVDGNVAQWVRKLWRAK